jgi:hypothetical protein
MPAARRGEKVFVKWLMRGPAEKRRLADQVIACIVPIFEQAGFSWAQACFYGRPQINEIPLERRNDDGSVDFVSISFNKFRKPQFDIQGLRLAPHDNRHWIRNGYLVWKQDDDVRYTRWGPKWWQVNRVQAEKESVEVVRNLVPQLLNYLVGDQPGPNVRVWPTLRSEAGEGVTAR